MARDRMQTSSRSTGQRIAQGMGVFFGFCALLALLIWYRGNRSTEIRVPSPKMPSPNALDYFLRAANGLQNTAGIDAAASMPTSGASRDATLPTSFPATTIPRATKASLVQANSASLATLRQGFAYPCREIPVRSFDTRLPFYAQCRKLARLVRLEGAVKSARGDANGAINSYLDAIELGTAIPHGATVIGELVGIACQSIGRVDAWKEIDHLTAREARAAVTRLEHIQASEPTFADALQEEKWSTVAGLQEGFRRRNWAHTMVGWYTSPNTGATQNPLFDLQRLSEFALETQVAIIGKGTILHNYMRYMDQYVANSHLPYAAHKPEPPRPTDIISQLIMPVFHQTQVKQLVNDTQNSLLCVALALRAYRLEHNAYPATLDTLVSGGYLKSVPADLFALQGSLHYRQQGAKYLLYSVGPNGIDDGGKPIDNRQQVSIAANPNARYFIKEDSQGDIVAGVNRW